MAIKLSEKQVADGWKIVKFGEIAKNISKRVDPAETELEVYVGLEHLDPQSLRITRRGVPADVKGQKLRVRSGQIIFGKRRAYQKKLAVADFDGYCSAHAMVLEEVAGKIIPGLLPFFMQSDMFMDRAVAISEGSLSPTIKWKTLAIQEFPLPPLERQKAILEVLEKLQENSIKAENSYKAGCYSQKRVMNNLINSLLKSSSYKTLSDIGVTYGGLNGKMGSDFGKSGKPYITYLNVYNNFQISPEGVDLVIIKPEEKQNIVKQGDVLFTISSETAHEVGISSVVTECLCEVYLNSFCFGFRLNELISFESLYLKYFFRSNYFRQEIRKLAQGSTRFNLSRNEFLKIKIPEVSIKKQLEICKSLEKYSYVNTLLAHKITNLSKLKRNISESFFNITRGVQ